MRLGFKIQCSASNENLHLLFTEPNGSVMMNGTRFGQLVVSPVNHSAHPVLKKVMPIIPAPDVVHKFKWCTFNNMTGHNCPSKDLICFKFPEEFFYAEQWNATLDVKIPTWINPGVYSIKLSYQNNSSQSDATWEVCTHRTGHTITIPHFGASVNVIINFNTTIANRGLWRIWGSQFSQKQVVKISQYLIVTPVSPIIVKPMESIWVGSQPLV